MRDNIPALARKYGFQGTLQEYYRFLLRFDIHTAVCIAHGEDVRSALREPEAGALWKWPRNGDRFKEEMLKAQRKYFYYSLQHSPLNVFHTVFRGVVHTFLLCLLVKEVPCGQWEALLNQRLQRFPSSWFGPVCAEIQAEYLSELRKMQESVSRLQLAELQQFLKSLEAVAAAMEQALEHLKNQNGEQEVRSTKTHTRGRSPFEPLTNLQKVRLVCFLECCESVQTGPEEHWLDLLRAKWPEFFPAVSLEQKEERWLSRALVLRLPGQVERIRLEDKSELSKYCRAMGAVLDHGGLKNLESAAHLNSILLMRAVMMTMAYANLDKLVSRTEDTLLADTLSYLENVTYVASDEENNIILEFIRLFRPDGSIHRECVLLAQKYRSALSKNFNAVCKAMEQKNRNIRQVSNLSDRLKEMEDSLRNASFTAKRDIVLGLDRGSYGHRLGELYRFAEGLDQRDAEQVRELLGCIFQLLDTLGITPVSQERLDECIEEDDVLYDGIASEGSLVREGARILRYPGWAVQGVQVVPPVYTIKQEEDGE